MTQNKVDLQRLYDRVDAVRGRLEAALDIVNAQGAYSTVDEHRLSVRSSLADFEE